MMTRENLIQAIYDNTDEWSCNHPCPHTNEEDNPKDVCMKCAVRMLDRYEQEIRAKVIEKAKELIKVRLVDNLSLADATKYGNKNAKQQENSYSTVMKYEIAQCVDDLVEDLEQMKG